MDDDDDLAPKQADPEEAKERQLSFVGVMVPVYFSLLSFFVLLALLSVSSDEKVEKAKESLHNQFKHLDVNNDSEDVANQVLGDRVFTVKELFQDVIQLAMSKFGIELSDIVKGPNRIIVKLDAEKIFLGQSGELYPKAQSFFISLFHIASAYNAVTKLDVSALFHWNLYDHVQAPPHKFVQVASLAQSIVNHGFKPKAMELSIESAEDEKVLLIIEANH